MSSSKCTNLLFLGFLGLEQLSLLREELSEELFIDWDFVFVHVEVFFAVDGQFLHALDFHALFAALNRRRMILFQRLQHLSRRFTKKHRVKSSIAKPFVQNEQNENVLIQQLFLAQILDRLEVFPSKNAILSSY